MAKPSQILESLKKLYEKRATLDKQILATEKNFVTEADKAEKAISKSVVAKKPVANKSVSPKPRGRKPANPAL